jgi:glycosyltransferase involved in cell wall biosynthesis
VPQVSTLHGRLDLPELDPLYHEYAEMPVISISNAQRRPLPHAWWIGTVYHGLPAGEFRFTAEPDDYFAFLGRISVETRLDRAIAIAKACGRRIRVAATVDPTDVGYFHEQIEPLLDDPLVEFIGEIGDADKNDFLGRAHALLFPIDWPEPFGLVLIESLACGTPVIAFRSGSVPEIIQDGVTGFIVEGVEQAVEADGRVGALSRRACRDAFERRFTAARMAADYVRVNERFAEQPRSHRIA